MKKRKIEYMELREGVQIPLNFHFIEKHFSKLKNLEKNDIPSKDYCDEYSGYTSVNSFYKASSIIYSNED